MNLLSRNMAQVEVFILQIKFQSLNLPGQCDIKICQVHVVSLEDEVTIVEQVWITQMMGCQQALTTKRVLLMLS